MKKSGVGVERKKRKKKEMRERRQGKKADIQTK